MEPENNMFPMGNSYIVVLQGKGTSGSGVMSWHDFETQEKYEAEIKKEAWSALEVVIAGVSRETAANMCKKSAMPATSFFASRTAHVELGSTRAFEGV